ncbi:MAG: hypothetical protein Q4D05_05370, partial [Acinetobacter sp.]|nr:hypothetical protein [Acinetobacter sp.]
TEHRPEILGLWALQEKGNQCVEYYNFRKNKQLLIVSGEERIVAEYDYQEPENLEQKHPLMTMKVLADNGQTDCWGDRADQSNSTQVTQIRWENPHQLQLCFDEKSCFTMHRVRP